MKRLLFFLSIVIICLGITLSLTSCDDKDDDGICNIENLQNGGCD